MLHAVSFHDANSWTRAFTDQRRDFDELAKRLKHRTRDEWVSGTAANYFTGLDITLLNLGGRNERLLKWLGESEEAIRRRQIEFGALAQWLDKYLTSNA